MADATAQLPIVHDLQFGTYTTRRQHRCGHHATWLAATGLTRSHHRPAGMWLRVGDRSWWFCLVLDSRWRAWPGFVRQRDLP